MKSRNELPRKPTRTSSLILFRTEEQTFRDMCLSPVFSFLGPSPLCVHPGPWCTAPTSRLAFWLRGSPTAGSRCEAEDQVGDFSLGFLLVWSLWLSFLTRDYDSHP